MLRRAKLKPSFRLFISGLFTFNEDNILIENITL